MQGQGWLTNAQFVDGLAMDGVLPAPLVIFLTVVGYVAGELPGALAITVGAVITAVTALRVEGEVGLAVARAPVY